MHPQVHGWKDRLLRMGVSRLGLLGALMTSGVSANAVLPLVAQQQIAEKLGSEGHYQLFLNATTLFAFPFLVCSQFLLKGKRTRTVARAGFTLLMLLNSILYLTDLQWHPLALRALVGIVFGLTIPMGQFSLAAAELDEHERVSQFTMMLNLVALGLSVIPFAGIGILWISHGNASLLFLALACVSGILAILSSKWIEPDSYVHQCKLRDLRLTDRQRAIAIADGSVILLTRSAYALVLVWLSQIISNFGHQQIISLSFTLPFLIWGFTALPLLRRLQPLQSLLAFLVTPFALLALALASGNSSILPALLAGIALLSIPEAFTPGQMISQWQSSASRQFGNVLTMALMTIGLSAGPAALMGLYQLGTRWPLVNQPSTWNSSLWLLILLLPLMIVFIRKVWVKVLIPPLKRH